MNNDKIKWLKDKWLNDFDEMAPFSEPDTSESVELMIKNMPTPVREEVGHVSPHIFAAIALFARQTLYKH